LVLNMDSKSGRAEVKTDMGKKIVDFGGILVGGNKKKNEKRTSKRQRMARNGKRGHLKEGSKARSRSIEGRKDIPRITPSTSAERAFIRGELGAPVTNSMGRSVVTRGTFEVQRAECAGKGSGTRRENRGEETTA